LIVAGTDNLKNLIII